ncbi:MAG: hypothetical protein ABIK28_07560 [Planctomycetota bacterium]
MSARPRSRTDPHRILRAMIVETLRETRGWGAPFLVFSGGFVLVLVGRNLPSGLDRPGGLAGAFSYGGLCLALSFMAMALGAWAMATDERSGFRGFLLSKPARGAVYFLGRFAGLAIRLAGIFMGALLINGCLMQLLDPDCRFLDTVAAREFRMGDEKQPMEQTGLLAPRGAQAQWIFEAKGPAESRRAEVQFKLRSRYPRDRALQCELPLAISVFQGESTLLSERLTLKNRKSLNLLFETHGPERICVILQVTGGQNFLELSGRDCLLVQGGALPAIALLRAGVSFLPLLLLILCTGLVFSTFVSTGTAFLASAVLSLLVVSAPSLDANLERVAAGGTSHDCLACSAPSLPKEAAQGTIEHEHGEANSFLKGFALAAGHGLALLPDARSGESMDALSRQESPAAAELWHAWKAFLPHLAILLGLGALLAGRRRS